jgi:hypothetical protein
VNRRALGCTGDFGNTPEHTADVQAADSSAGELASEHPRKQD